MISVLYGNPLKFSIEYFRMGFEKETDMNPKKCIVQIFDKITSKCSGKGMKDGSRCFLLSLTLSEL